MTTQNNVSNVTPPTYSDKNAERVYICSKLLFPSILYACIYVLLLYKNYNSITMPLFVLATLGYCLYCIKMFQMITQKVFVLYAIGMLSLGISTCCTNSILFHVVNFLGIILILLCMLLHQYFNVRNWTLAKYITELGSTLLGTIGCLTDFFSDITCLGKTKANKRNTVIGYILLGIGISIPFLIFVTILFCSADAVFKDFVTGIFDFDFKIADVIGVLFTFVMVLLTSYCCIRFFNRKEISEDVPDFRRFEPIIANTILSLTGILYLLFSSIQILYLFLGNMTLPDGYTYAEYAREGFFQLLFVSLLNIVLVLFFLSFFRENKFLKVLLTIISGCTYIMLASSALRMCMYISIYRLTSLRIFVLWFLALLAFLLAGVIILIYKHKFPIFRYMLVIVSVFYIGLSFAHPDYWIAKYNLSHPAPSMETYEIGNEYLQHLSADAAPAIVSCKEPWVENYRNRIIKEYKKDIRSFNFSTWNAYRLLKK